MTANIINASQTFVQAKSLNAILVLRNCISLGTIEFIERGTSIYIIKKNGNTKQTQTWQNLCLFSVLLITKFSCSLFLLQLYRHHHYMVTCYFLKCIEGCD